MVCFTRGGRAWVTVGDREASEHAAEVTTAEGVMTRTCYIEAKEGDEFSVKYKDIPIPTGHVIQCNLYIDGNFANGYSIGCDDQSLLSQGNFEGFKEKILGELQNLRAFTFGKMTTTSVGSAKTMPDKQVSNICTIRIEVTCVKRIGPLNHNRQDRELEVPIAPVLHEDSKKALLGLNTVPGKVLARKVGRTCHCQFQRHPVFKEVVLFNYMPRVWLVTKGLIPDKTRRRRRRTERTDESDDDDEGEGSRERRPAAQGRHVRVKREETIRSETVKGESIIYENASRRVESHIDLTADGEYVSPSRKVGETIVLSDDSEGSDDDD